MAKFSENGKITQKTQNSRLSGYLMLVQRAQNSVFCFFFMLLVRGYVGTRLKCWKFMSFPAEIHILSHPFSVVWAWKISIV